jgi:hypothetical protein
LRRWISTITPPRSCRTLYIIGEWCACRGLAGTYYDRFFAKSWGWIRMRKTTRPVQRFSKMHVSFVSVSFSIYYNKLQERRTNTHVYTQDLQMRLQQKAAQGLNSSIPRVPAGNPQRLASREPRSCQRASASQPRPDNCRTTTHGCAPLPIPACHLCDNLPISVLRTGRRPRPSRPTRSPSSTRPCGQWCRSSGRHPPG